MWVNYNIHTFYVEYKIGQYIFQWPQIDIGCKTKHSCQLYTNYRPLKYSEVYDVSVLLQYTTLTWELKTRVFISF